MLNLSIETVSERIAHCLFSREPYRHVQIEITVVNDGDASADAASYELLIPESVIFNLSGDTWNPLFKENVNGTTYDVWQTLGGGGYSYGSRGDGYVMVGQRYSALPGGVTLYPKGRWHLRLAVNLKPDELTIEVLWQLFERGDPVGDFGRTTLALQPLAAHF